MKVAHVSDNHSNASMVCRIGKSDAELLIWTGDGLNDIGPIGFGHKICPPLEREYQLSALMRMAPELATGLRGRPLVFVRGNHDHIEYAPVLSQFGIDIHEITDRNPLVEVMDKKFAGFRQIPYICGDFPGEATQDQLDEIVARVIDLQPDILVTHAPPKGILDYGPCGSHWGIEAIPLLLAYEDHKITHHFFGHCHYPGGKVEEKYGVKFVNGACHFKEHEI